MSDLDARIRSLLAAGDAAGATTVTVRELGPEVLGFLTGVLGSHHEADEVFASLSERLWHSLKRFEGRCSIRTWTYVLARHEMTRYRRGMRRHVEGRTPIAELEDVLAVVRTTRRPAMSTGQQTKVRALRDSLPEEDRALLILRLDRSLSWEEVALVLADLRSPPGREPRQALSDEERKREAARLRKRFQLVKRRLAAQVRPHDELRAFRSR
jgi:RNA polymerase sigma-70 factor (ECF subfamily)